MDGDSDRVGLGRGGWETVELNLWVRVVDTVREGVWEAMEDDVMVVSGVGSLRGETGSECFEDGGRERKEAAADGGSSEEDLGNGCFAGDTSERGRAEEELWLGEESVAALTWQLLGDGGLVSGSDKARASGQVGLVDFLCLDLGEG